MELPAALHAPFALITESKSYNFGHIPLQKFSLLVGDLFVVEKDFAV